MCPFGDNLPISIAFILFLQLPFFISVSFDFNLITPFCCSAVQYFSNPRDTFLSARRLSLSSLVLPGLSLSRFLEIFNKSYTFNSMSIHFPLCICIIILMDILQTSYNQCCKKTKQDETIQTKPSCCVNETRQVGCRLVLKNTVPFN